MKSMQAWCQTYFCWVLLHSKNNIYGHNSKVPRFF